MSLQTVILALSTNAMRLRSDDPPFSVASATIRFHFPAICRTSAAASESPITSSTHRLTSTARSTPPPSTCARTPTRQSRTTSCVFMLWSDICGTHTMDTPLATLSSTEFQPQCVTKHPTAACDSTRTWSHHSTATPFLRRPRTSASASPSAAMTSFRMTQRYGLPLPSRPRRSSSSCSLAIEARLPKET
ncbi:hypothetical protein PVAP13_4NG212411 [Panicum virgatum]|uniref:Uncharacterized protein n=1 Tax=Panicum virgatum TaxID=38727 RepID=A0A8T0T5M5_PANVG|nr:hypothetical protein PVAP13_4NG212411 [Panicum virgatum]